ncbi:MAG: hypothetical protein HY220_02285 [Candidatus Sungbacteria bacterium]|uniref:Uncharacterized protein n=1 Tax=Candidatus Sungiibacteriota bacterium TaxID=2750080 RepID=A0A9D6LNE6_9BACT|nr:hypothetical protein [Candidatus Sungbacteria bacterium]
MRIPDWLKEVGTETLFWSVLGVGLHFWHKHNPDAEMTSDPKERHRRAAEGFGRELGHIFDTDRIEMVQDLGRFNCQRIVQLLEYMNTEGGFIPVGDTYTRENWIVNMLTKVPQRDRAKVYPELEQLLWDSDPRQGVANFIARLGIYHNDGLAEFLKMAIHVVAQTTLPRLAAADQAVAQQIDRIAYGLRAINARNARGWRRWI